MQSNFYLLKSRSGKMKTVLIVGAAQNLGHSLANHYVSEPNTILYATSRYGKPFHHAPNIHWISNVDLSSPNAGLILSQHYDRDFPMDIVYIATASLSSSFAEETLEKLSFEKEMAMYRTNAVGPLFLVQHLLQANIISQNTKIIFIGSEAGSVSLRTQGGNYGFHGSQAALNMVAKLLSVDLAPRSIPVGVVYPGLPIESDDGHHQPNPEPHHELAAKALAAFAEKQFGMDKTGQLWATQGFKCVF
jgi:NAD(P)-dependent dehydrogenase (short-subunit alcohol dehydrogenase family)